MQSGVRKKSPFCYWILPAQKFWGKVIAEYTNGKYDMFTVMEANETGFTFDNSL